jgi:HSP20 family protein
LKVGIDPLQGFIEIRSAGFPAILGGVNSKNFQSALGKIPKFASMIFDLASTLDRSKRVINLCLICEYVVFVPLIYPFSLILWKKEECLMIVRRLGGWPTWDVRSAFDDMERMRRQMDRLLEGLPGAWREPAAGVFPLTNVTEDAESYYVRAELPGVKADALDISVTGNSLSISGERKIPSEDENARYHRREREAGRFSRMISLPGEIDSTKVDARCSDGILTIILPKAEKAKPRQITVKTA